MNDPVAYIQRFMPTEHYLPASLPNTWIARSALQKYIRRGQADLAAQTILTLRQIDPNVIWKRLLVIAFEDIGIGDIDAVITATAATSAAWRKAIGSDDDVAIAVTRLLSMATKDRNCEALWTTAALHPDLRRCRYHVFEQTIPEQLAEVADTTSPLVKRAVAAWFSSGVDHWQNNRIGDGDLPALLKTYRDLGVSDSVVDATAWAIKKEREPIFTMLPLLALTADHALVTAPTVLPIAMEGDVPLCALDKFSRTGKAAIAEFAVSSPATSKMLNDLLPFRHWSAATGLGVFYCEGFLVTPKLQWSQSASIERMGMEADFLRLGFPVQHITQFIDTVRIELSALNCIRTKMLATAMSVGGGYHG